MKGIGPKLISIAMFIPILVVFVVGWSQTPPPKPENLTTISGTFEQMTSPCCGKWVISLREDAYRYEVRKDLVSVMEVEDMQKMVQPGDSLTFQVFNLKPSPFNPGGKNRPVASIQGSGRRFLALEDTQLVRRKKE